MFSPFTNEQFNIYFISFLTIVFSIFSSLSTSLIVLPTKTSPDKFYLSSRFFLKIIQHIKSWNVIGAFLSYKLEEKELILFLKSCIMQIFVHKHEFAVLHSQISWVIQVVSYKSLHRLCLKKILSSLIIHVSNFSASNFNHKSFSLSIFNNFLSMY